MLGGGGRGGGVKGSKCLDKEGEGKEEGRRGILPYATSKRAEGGGDTQRREGTFSTGGKGISFVFCKES